MLGTGHGNAYNLYNTCFLLDNNGETLLVDTGGSNQIIINLKEKGYSLMDIHHIFISHCHTDHILGLLWIFREIAVLFLKGKYKDKLNDDFVLGYYIHLYTDYLWFKYFEPDFYKNGVIYKLDGSEEYVPAEQKRDYFYNDYTNLNIKLSRTEYAGLGAGLLNSSLVTGFTFISMLFISNIFLAKSYQLH